MQLPLGRFVSITSEHNVTRDESRDVNVHVLPRFYKIIILIEWQLCKRVLGMLFIDYNHFPRNKVLCCTESGSEMYHQRATYFPLDFRLLFITPTLFNANAKLNLASLCIHYKPRPIVTPIYNSLRLYSVIKFHNPKIQKLNTFEKKVSIYR
jgi:hypothetical protein